MCWGNPSKSLALARSRLTPEQWSRFERDFDDFCVISGFKEDPFNRQFGVHWARWAFFQGRQYRAMESEPVAWECASPVGERPALAFLTSKKPTVENYEEQGWRVTPLYLGPSNFDRHKAAIRSASDSYFEKIAIAMMSDEQAQMSLERWKQVNLERGA